VLLQGWQQQQLQVSCQIVRTCGGLMWSTSLLLLSMCWSQMRKRSLLLLLLHWQTNSLLRVMLQPQLRLLLS
jgi:hypothetical protein